MLVCVSVAREREREREREDGIERGEGWFNASVSKMILVIFEV